MIVGMVLGMVLGALLAPLVFLVALVRGARVFHPDGVVHRARFTALGDHPAARALDGPALARLAPTFTSVASQKPDVIGLAVRFRRDDTASPAPADGDQDVLSATFDSFLALGAGRASTNVHDVLDNTFRTVASFALPGGGAHRLRWVGVPIDRPASLPALADPELARRARFVLEISQDGDAWLAIGTLALGARVDVDQRALELTPFRTGRGVRPVGFLNGIRRVVYPASEAGRRLRAARQ
jgi:hypothetical protein